MKKADSSKNRLQKAENKQLDTPSAAGMYIQAGMKKLNLKPSEERALFNKLAPIVTRQIGVERSRAVTRGESMVNKAEAKKVKSATKKIMGGK
jgi:hypothetical protein